MGRSGNRGTFALRSASCAADATGIECNTIRLQVPLGAREFRDALRKVRFAASYGTVNNLLLRSELYIAGSMQNRGIRFVVEA